MKAKYPGLTHNRIPVCNSAAPLEPDFDTICNALCGTNVNTPVVVNCQVKYSVKQNEKRLCFIVTLSEEYYFNQFYPVEYFYCGKFDITALHPSKIVNNILCIH
jgi:hypothetical protein